LVADGAVLAHATSVTARTTSLNFEVRKIQTTARRA